MFCFVLFSNSFAINSVMSGAVLAVSKYAKPAPVGKAQDFKLSRIISKFKSGKKLTGGELAYLARNAPDVYGKVVRIMKQRQQLERRLAMARSKEEAAKIIMEEMQSIEKMTSDGGDDFEKTARLNQTMDAYNAYLSERKLPPSRGDWSSASMRAVGDGPIRDVLELSGVKENFPVTRTRQKQRRGNNI